jgi:hypothetical protein
MVSLLLARPEESIIGELFRASLSGSYEIYQNLLISRASFSTV